MARSFGRAGLIGLMAAALVAVPVTASASGQLQVTSTPALYPSFATSIHYYVSRCQNNPLTLHVTVPAGTQVSVDGQPPQSGTTFTTHVALTEGQEFQITWSGNPQSYHVRCLPADFPAWTSDQKAGQTQTSFFVVTPDISTTHPLTPPLPPPYVAVFDTNGVPRWWFKEGPQPLDAKALPNGNLVWWLQPNDGTHEQHALNGAVVHTYAPAGPAPRAPADFHDIQFAPPSGNGNYFLIVDGSRTMDLSSCGGPSSANVIDPIIQELNSSGGLLWSWDTADHINVSEVGSAWRSNCASGDPFHMNALQLDAGDGNIIASFRHLDALYKISLSNKAILWKLGGSATSASLSIKDDPNCSPNSCAEFGGQHDPRLFTDTQTQQTYLTLHENGSGRNRAPRALRFLIDAGSNPPTATLVETASDSSVTSSICCGSARKLPGGHWLVDWGGTPQIDELAPSNGGSVVVFTLKFSGVFSYRADPVTDPGYGSALTSGMNAQYPRSPQGGGPPTNIPETPGAVAVPLVGVGAAFAVLALRGRRRRASR